MEQCWAKQFCPKENTHKVEALLNQAKSFCAWTLQFRAEGNFPSLNYSEISSWSEGRLQTSKASESDKCCLQIPSVELDFSADLDNIKVKPIVCVLVLEPEFCWLQEDLEILEFWNCCNFWNCWNAEFPSSSAVLHPTKHVDHACSRLCAACPAQNVQKCLHSSWPWLNICKSKESRAKPEAAQNQRQLNKRHLCRPSKDYTSQVATPKPTSHRVLPTSNFNLKFLPKMTPRETPFR